ncbi:MAG TPA: hypothetical protein VGL39_18930 [Jatrophihabitantaceae bacterium]
MSPQRRHAVADQGEAPNRPRLEVTARPEYAAALRPGDVFRFDGDLTSHICLATSATRERTLSVSLESGVVHCSRTTLVLITGIR